MVIAKSNMENLNFKFKLLTNVCFGVGEALKLRAFIKKFKYIGLIVDEQVKKTDYFAKIYNSVSDLSISSLFTYNYGEPTYELLEKYRDEFINNDILVAVGGGSVIDFTKGVAFLANNSEPALSYRGFPRGIEKPTPILTMPTTAGTGSEVTYNAVFIDSNRKKLGINTVLNFPKHAILDAKLVQTCPKAVMISSGLDALTHALESFGAKKATTISRMFSENAIHLLLSNLQNIKNKYIKLEIIANLQLGAYYAGIALMNSGSGPAGAMSYVIGPKFSIPHGLACAAFLPHIIEHNEKKGFKYPIKNLSSKLFTLYELLNVDCNNIRKYNVKTAHDLRILIEGVEKLQPAFDQQVIKFTVEDAKDIIRKMVK